MVKGHALFFLGQQGVQTLVTDEETPFTAE